MNLPENQNHTISNFQTPESQQQEIILKGLKREIKGENIRIFFLNLGSWILFLIAIILLIVRVSFQNQENLSLLLSYWLIIPLIFISFWLIVIGGTNAYNFRQEKKVHLNLEEFNTNRLPVFITNSYKRNLGIRIFINWLAVVSYVLITFVLIVLFWLRGKVDPSLNIGNVRVTIEGEFSQFTNEIIFLFLGLSGALVLHVFTFINTNRKKTNLNNLFDVNNKIDKNELKIYKRKVRILCATLFLAPLFVLLLIFWIWKRKKSK